MDNLIGLVVCGGQSSRMGSDKSMIEYHGQPHSHYLFNILREFCNLVYLSVNELQSGNTNNSYPYITDSSRYSKIGPMSALLSAWQKFPNASLLAVGCDYPFIKKETIQTLTLNRKGNATCFIHPEKNIHEPLITIYESSFYPAVLNCYNKKKYSLSKILKYENVNAIFPSTFLMLQNANTTDDYLSAKKLINENIY